MDAPELDTIAGGSTLLRLEGRDALEVLHRISTAHLADLAPGQARATLFCDFRGRLLHRVVVAVTSDGAVWLLRDDAPAGPLAAHVDRHVFREDVRVSDHGGGRCVRPVPGGVSLAHGTLREVDAVPAAVQAREDFALIVEMEPAIEPDAALERARIEAAWPRHGREIAEEFNPYEVGLAGEVHLSKGCYTGQEALQRLVTYKSVRRRLCRVSGAGEPPDTPATLTAGGERAGRITSAAPDGLGNWLGLAAVRVDLADGAAVTIDSGEGQVTWEPLPDVRPLGLP